MIDSITPYIKKDDDFLFREGMEEGTKKGIEQKTREAILKLLKDGVLTTQQLASYFDVTEEFVEELRKTLTK